MSASRTGGRSARASAIATRGTKKVPRTTRAPKTAPQRASKSAPSKRPKPPPFASALEDDAIFRKVRALCLSLPDTKLTMTWGSPHFRVGEKIFCGYGREGERPVLGVKLTMAHARAVVKEQRFWPAPYVGKHGWVSLDVGQRKSWDEVTSLIRESYGLIAPKASLAKMR